VLVEDCVGIGRAFGGGVANCLSRPGEPITFRRCHLWALDWWGDTAAAYVRVENKDMPENPDVLFEDCTLVSPQCALKSSNYGFQTFTRTQCTRCCLIALNFSQPHGTPTDGIIQSVQEGRFMYVTLEDCTLMGYKVFGVTVKKETEGDIGFETKGDVKAYVQFQQDLPAGFHRLAHWPVEVFQSIVPRAPLTVNPHRPSTQLVCRDVCELSPFLYQGRLCHLECQRPGHGGTASDYFLVLRDAETGQTLSRCAEGYGLASLLVHNDRFHIFASRWDEGTWRDVTLFTSADLSQWESKRVIEGENEGIFNSSVCAGPNEFVMAYESNDAAYSPFTVKFARSDDLQDWTKIPEAVFGTNRYAACPCLRYSDGWYYLLYLERRAPRHVFETYIARSRDLIDWDLSAANPVLRAVTLDEGINASDPAILELEGKTHLYYAVGDQLTWMNIKRSIYPCTLAEFLASWFTSPSIPDGGSSATVPTP
jgi:hypothetical protein